MKTELDIAELSYEELPTIEGWHSVEFFRKVRDRRYKEAHGIPCDEEKEYIESAVSNFDDKITEWKRNRKLAVA